MCGLQGLEQQVSTCPANVHSASFVASLRLVVRLVSCGGKFVTGLVSHMTSWKGYGGMSWLVPLLLLHHLTPPIPSQPPLAVPPGVVPVMINGQALPKQHQMPAWAVTPGSSQWLQLARINLLRI